MKHVEDYKEILRLIYKEKSLFKSQEIWWIQFKL